MRSADVTRACAVLLLAPVTLLLVPLPGTSDVQSFWLPWMHNVSSLGIVHGYAVSASDYPPGCAIILALTHRAGHALGVDDFVALKCSIVAFLWISTWQFWRWTRRFAIAVTLQISLMLEAVALGYIDIYFARVSSAPCGRCSASGRDGLPRCSRPHA
jgi:hypothetical protein